VPIRNSSVRFGVASGGGAIDQADATTDVFGIAAALVNLGPQIGEQQFTAQAGGLNLDFFRSRTAAAGYRCERGS